MQGGYLWAWDVTGGQGASPTLSEPIFARGLILAEQTADFLLQGLSRGMPIWFDQPTQFVQSCTPPDALILNFACDRASANLKAVQWIWAQIASLPAGPRIFPHLELCGAHGIHLAKCKPTGSKTIVSGMHSLCVSLRQWRFGQALRDAILSIVRERCRMVRAPPP